MQGFGIQAPQWRHSTGSSVVPLEAYGQEWSRSGALLTATEAPAVEPSGRSRLSPPYLRACARVDFTVADLASQVVCRRSGLPPGGLGEAALSGWSGAAVEDPGKCGGAAVAVADQRPGSGAVAAVGVGSQVSPIRISIGFGDGSETTFRTMNRTTAQDADTYDGRNTLAACER
jgi:hypothetical protein